MWRIGGALILIVGGSAMFLAGLFYAWMSGFAPPPDRGTVVALSVAGMIVGVGSAGYGVTLIRTRSVMKGRERG